MHSGEYQVSVNCESDTGTGTIFLQKRLDCCINQRNRVLFCFFCARVREGRVKAAEKMSDRKVVIKNADMSEDMQQDAVDCACQALEKYNIEKASWSRQVALLLLLLLLLFIHD